MINTSPAHSLTEGQREAVLLQKGYNAAILERDGSDNNGESAL
jgi:hypothetical protein